MASLCNALLMLPLSDDFSGSLFRVYVCSCVPHRLLRFLGSLFASDMTRELCRWPRSDSVRWKDELLSSTNSLEFLCRALSSISSPSPFFLTIGLSHDWIVACDRIGRHTSFLNASRSWSLDSWLPRAARRGLSNSTRSLASLLRLPWVRRNRLRQAHDRWIIEVARTWIFFLIDLHRPRVPITWRLRLLSCMMHRWIATVSAWKLIVELEFDAKLFLDATFDHILTWLYSFALQWTQSRRLGPWFKLVHFAMIDRSVQVFNCDSDTVFHHGLAIFIIGQFRSYFPTIGRCLGLVGMILP